MPKDLFICHASEDKEAVARPLAEALQREGATVWLDELVLKLGDSLRSKIDEGLRECRFGIVLLSPSFFSKHWPKWELDGLADRELTTGKKVILPIWHKLDHDDVAAYSPPLAGKFAARMSDGLPKVVQSIMEVLAEAESEAGAPASHSQRQPQSEAPEEPAVVLAHPSAHVNKGPAPELGEGKRKLTMVAPEYLIENHDPNLPIRTVTTGVRTRDGRAYTFEGFYAQFIGVGRNAPVTNVRIPDDFLEDVHESGAITAFLFWTRFTLQRVRWEAVYDPEKRLTTYSVIPMPNPELGARVARRGAKDRRLVIENTGDVRIEQVDCELPADIMNWSLMTEVMPWPLAGLEPGESQDVPLVVAMGPASVELTLRGRAEAVPYERKQLVSAV